MTIQAATPYLILPGNADKAIAHYQHALGATLDTLQRFGDMMENCPEAQRNLVMHSVLKVGNTVIMISDGGPQEPVKAGGPVQVALVPDDADEAQRCFDGLAESGKIVEPLAKAPWGALFGAVQDKFGVSWMINCTPTSA